MEKNLTQQHLTYALTGVKHLLVEKLSAKAPDGPTKLKILSARAEKHNIKWEPKSFGDNDTKASQDLLLVEKSFVKAPDGPTKIKILSAIPEEHNIIWEPKSFADNDTNAS